MKEAKLKNTLTFISRELNGFSFDLTYCKHLMICSLYKVAGKDYQSIHCSPSRQRLINNSEEPKADLH